MAGPVRKANHCAGIFGDVDKLAESDELQVTALECWDGRSVGVEPADQLGDLVGVDRLSQHRGAGVAGKLSVN